MKSLTVFGKKISIQRAPLSSQGILGFYSPHENKVVICTSLSGEAYYATLIHELMHCVFVRAGLAQSIRTEVEEIVCEQVSIAILENFKIKQRGQ